MARGSDSGFRLRAIPSREHASGSPIPSLRRCVCRRRDRERRDRLQQRQMMSGTSMNPQTISFTAAPSKGHDTLLEMLALAGEILEAESTRIDPDEPLGYLGFDSASLKLLATRMSQRFGAQIDTV